MPLIQSSDSLPNFLHTLFCPKVSITTALYCHPSTYRLFYCESAVARAARAAQRTSRRAHIRPPCATQTAFTQSESVPAGGQVIQPQRPSICAIQRVPPKQPTSASKVSPPICAYRRTRPCPRAAAAAADVGSAADASVPMQACSR